MVSTCTQAQLHSVLTTHSIAGTSAQLVAATRRCGSTADFVQCLLRTQPSYPQPKVPLTAPPALPMPNLICKSPAPPRQDTIVPHMQKRLFRGAAGCLIYSAASHLRPCCYHTASSAPQSSPHPSTAAHQPAKQPNPTHSAGTHPEHIHALGWPAEEAVGTSVLHHAAIRARSRTQSTQQQLAAHSGALPQVTNSSSRHHAPAQPRPSPTTAARLCCRTTPPKGSSSQLPDTTTAACHKDSSRQPASARASAHGGR
jgi:hypothetical protein